GKVQERRLQRRPAGNRRHPRPRDPSRNRSSQRSSLSRSSRGGRQKDPRARPSQDPEGRGRCLLPGRHGGRGCCIAPDDMRIVFMGTPEFAVPSLKILLEQKYRVAGVVTAADKPAGRGLELSASQVKLFAAERGLTILQPEKLKDPSFVSALKTLEPGI